MSASVTVERLDAPWACDACGAGVEASCVAPRPGTCRIDHDGIVGRLEQAGATLLAMRVRSPYPATYGTNWPQVLHDAVEAYGWTDEPTRPALPDSATISRMDVTFNWLGAIPNHRHVLRRIVAARALVSPESGKHLLGWRRLARIIHADHHAIMRWHRDGIGIIINGLTNAPK